MKFIILYFYKTILLLGCLFRCWWRITVQHSIYRRYQTKGTNCDGRRRWLSSSKSKIVSWNFTTISCIEMTRNFKSICRRWSAVFFSQVKKYANDWQIKFPFSWFYYNMKMWQNGAINNSPMGQENGQSDSMMHQHVR